MTAFDAVPRVFGEALTPLNANWWLSETLCYLRHLQVTGRAEGDGASPERWRIAASKGREQHHRGEGVCPGASLLRSSSGELHGITPGFR